MWTDNFNLKLDVDGIEDTFVIRLFDIYDAYNFYDGKELSIDYKVKINNTNLYDNYIF